MVKKLLSLIPPHHTYVEVFGGGGSLLFAKEPSPVEVYNDVDGGLVNFYRVLRDPEKFKKFHRLVSLTPYSREEYYFCRSTWQEIEDEVERARRWFCVVRQSFGGHFAHSWGFSITASRRGMADTVSNYLSSVDCLPEAHERLRRVQVERQDFRECIRFYDTPDTFFYLDPPYVPSTRRHGEYAHEMSVDDHEELVEMLLQLQGMALLSGYPNEVYAPLEEAGWERREWDTACHAAGRTRHTEILGEGAARKMQPRTECVWFNYRLEGDTIRMFWEVREMLGKIAERVDLLVMVYDRYNRSGLPWRCEAWRHEDGGWAKASSKDGERLLRAVAQALEKGLNKGENDLGEV